MDEERFASLKELETRLGHQFSHLEWLDQALTHKSYIHQTNVTNKESNEVLEFLGDAVLNLVVSDLLYQTFPQAHEGILSVRRAHLVKQSSLAHLSKEIRLEEYLLLGKSELIDGGRKKASILANAYEALIGAIYMDSGFDQTLKVIRHHLEPIFRLKSRPFFLMITKASFKKRLNERMDHLPNIKYYRNLVPSTINDFRPPFALEGR